MIEPVTSQVSARRTCHKIEGKPLVVVGGQITTSEYGGMRKSDFYQQVGPHHDPDWAWEYRHRERARLQDQQQSPEDAVFSQQIVPMCEHPFKAIAVDTVDLLHKYCTDFVCKKHNIKHPSDMSFGKGFALVSSEFQRAFTKLASLPYGLFLVSHAVEREIETRTGKYHKTMPTLPESARKILVGMTDLILYVDLETVTNQDGSVAYNRVLRTKPDKHFEAGDRTGKLPDPLPLDFKAFKDAFEQAVAQPEQKKNKEKEDTKTGKPESPEKHNSPSKPKPGSRPNQPTSNTAVA